MVLARRCCSGSVALAVWSLILGCARTETPPDPGTTGPVAAPVPEAEPAAHAAPHFGYEGEIGPEHWADLSPDWAIARTGREQSPIDIRAASDDPSLPALAPRYLPCPLKVVNNGHTIQVNYAPGSHLPFLDSVYELQQFHFHAPSEHTVGGKAYPMEAHLVHQNAAGQLLVVGVFMDDGAENPVLREVLAAAPREEGERETELPILASGLLPSALSYCTYPGSLTTPPCTEGVTWIVLTRPVTVSPEQVAAFAAIVGHNARPTQPLGDRVVRRRP